VRIPSSLAYTVTAAIVITIVAGCAGSNLQAPPLNAGSSVGHSPGGANPLSAVPEFPTRSSPKKIKSWMNQPDHLAPLTYVSDYQNNDVTVFNRKGVVQGQIGGLDFPVGLFVDKNRNLWVANARAFDVLEYARGGTAPILTLNDSVGYPVGVTICPSGRVYVSNQVSYSDGPGNIEIYGPGKTNPGGALFWPGVTVFAYITCDKENNVFVTVSNGGSGARVIEFPRGDAYGAHDLGITLSYAGGIKADKVGNLLIVDPTNFKINEYTEAGSPTGISISTGTGQISDIALTKDNGVVGGADGTSYQRYGISWTYPGGVQRRIYKTPDSDPEPYGFAFDPAFDPGTKSN
jgi:hypothetical protein